MRLSGPLRISPDNVTAWYRKGKSFLSLAKYPDAITCFDQVISRDEHCDGAWLKKGSALLSIGQFEPAVAGIEPFPGTKTPERERLV